MSDREQVRALADEAALVVVPPAFDDLRRRASLRRREKIGVRGVASVVVFAGAAAILFSAGDPAAPPLPAEVLPSRSAPPTPGVDPVRSEPLITPPAAAVGLVPSALRDYVQGPSSPVGLVWKLDGYRMSQWKSANRFTLLVSFTLHYPGDPIGNFNEGANDRFLHFSRPSGTTAYDLSWSSSP